MGGAHAADAGRIPHPRRSLNGDIVTSAGSYGAWIPAPILWDPELPPEAKLFAGRVHALTHKNGYCNASNAFFAKEFGVSGRAVRRWLEQLEHRGHFTRIGHGRARKIYASTRTIESGNPDNPVRSTRTIESSVVKESSNRVELELPMESDSPEPDTSLESEVFDYWRERRASAMGKTSGPRMQPTKGRMSKIRGRLAEGYSVDDLKAAVDGCLSRDFNVENGYTDISLICRSQEKVEQYLHAARNGNGRPSRAMSTQEWLEREGMTAEEYKRELEEFDW